MRQVLKGIVERTAVLAGAARLARARHGHQAIILAYHNIVPRGESAVGDRSLHLSQDTFGAQLDALADTHDVVPLAQALGPGAGSRPRAVITFDDAYRGTLTAGAQELARRRLPATVFVPPGRLGDQTFWWDALADRGTGELPSSLRAQALDTLAGRQDAIVAWATGQGMTLKPVPAHARSVTEPELVQAVHDWGLTLGSHSWSHANLARLDAAALHEEVTRPLEWLRARFASPLAWLAYPYGRSNAEAESALAASGYAAGLRVSGGFVPATSVNAFALPRLNVPSGLSLDGFVLRVSGAVPG